MNGYFIIYVFNIGINKLWCFSLYKNKKTAFLKTLPSLSIRFILCVCVCAHARAQSCLTLRDPMDCGPPDCSVHGISQARILKQIAISLSGGSSQPRDPTCLSCISRISMWVLKLVLKNEVTEIRVIPINVREQTLYQRW